MSSSVLYERLGELAEAGLVTRGDSQSYRLTDQGRRLGTAIEPLDRWARAWARARPRS